MSFSSVWVQLYYEGKKEAVGEPFPAHEADLKPGREWNVAELKAAAMPGLDPPSLAMVKVYPPGTTSFTKVNSIRPGRKLANLIEEFEKEKTPPTSDDHPFIVVAPANGLGKNDDTLERIERKLDDMATVAMGMSEATQNFTRELLGAKGIVFKTLPVCTEVLDVTFSNRIYNWGEKEDEKDGQPGCKSMLEHELLPLSLAGRTLGIFDVRGLALPEVHEGKRKSNGFSDLAIGDLESLSLPDTRDLTFGLSAALIELKTGKAALKQGQLLLQLVSFSTISNTQKGVVVLGTDCATKWRLVYFTKSNEITMQQYTCGKKCLDDLSLFIQGSTEKGVALAPTGSPLSTVTETEFLEGAEDSANTSAYLDAVAHHLAGLFPSEREALTPTVDENRNPPPMIYL